MSRSGIGICLIGCGRAGMIHARNFMNKVPGAHMAAVVDVVGDVAETAAENWASINGGQITGRSWTIRISMR